MNKNYSIKYIVIASLSVLVLLAAGIGTYLYFNRAGLATTEKTTEKATTTTKVKTVTPTSTTTGTVTVDSSMLDANGEVDPSKMP